jgi:hypothetical protein
MRTLHDSVSCFAIGALLGVCALFAFAGCSVDDVSGAQSLSGNAAVGATAENVGFPGEQSDQREHPTIPFLPRPLGNEGIPEGGTYDPDTRWFICPAETGEHGATIQRAYAFFDAAGVFQMEYDEELTAAIGLRFELAANPEVEGCSGSVRAVHDLLVSGLVGAETTRIWSGTMSLESQGVPPRRPPGPRGADGSPGSGRERSGIPGPIGGPGGPSGADHPGRSPERQNRPNFEDLQIAETTRIQDVVLPFPLAEGTWPLSGAIARETRVEGGPHGAEARSSILTFNGTRYATLTIGGETTEIDLLNPPRPPRRPQE